MTTSIKDFERTFKTGAASLADKQYFIVKQHTDGSVILASAGTDKIVGVVYNKPAATQAALIRIGGTTKVVAAGTITVGAWVTADSAGKAVATVSAGDVVLGKYLGTASAAAGDVIEVQMGIFVL